MKNLEVYLLSTSIIISSLSFWILLIKYFFSAQKSFTNKLLVSNFFHFFSYKNILLWGLSLNSFVLFIWFCYKCVLLSRIPVSNLYETLVVLALFFASITLYLIKTYSKKEFWTLVSWPIFVVLMVLVSYALSLPTPQREALPLIPALESYWRNIHVPALLVSYVFFLIACISGASYLVVKKQIQNSSEDKALKQINQLNLISEIIYKCISLGFALLTFGIVTGAIWANISWGNLWQWDPKENLALATWFFYLAFLHLKTNRKASDLQLAWMSILGIAFVYLTYLGINQFDLGGLHTYGKV